MLVTPETSNLSYKCLTYGDNVLQRVGVWELPNASRQDPSSYWVIYIHGGAWRSPVQTLRDFVPSVQRMTSSPDYAPLSSIRGFASIDYRLSPNPGAPQDPATTPPSEMRVAKHPDHIADVRSALRRLDDEYHIGRNYVLIGHSAGGTLAFQLLMGADTPPSGQGPVVPPPAGVIGISGIYDLIGIDKRHNGDYSSFLVDAFGEDREAWRPASPTLFAGSYNQEWSRDCVYMLAWSPEDTLIDEPDLDDLHKKLVTDGIKELMVAKDLHGEHDFVWEEGSQIPRLFEAVLDRLHARGSL